MRWRDFAVFAVLASSCVGCEKSTLPGDQDAAVELLGKALPTGTTRETAQAFLTSLEAEHSLLTSDECRLESEGRGICSDGPAIIATLNPDAGPWYEPTSISIHCLIAFDHNQLVERFRVWTSGTLL
jgi:hypothetical protein